MNQIDVFCELKYEQCKVEDWQSKDVKKEFDFENKIVLGAGTYGKVYKVKSKQNNIEYALKCIKVMHDKEGVYINTIQFPITSLREIKFLTQLEHENVIQILDIYTTIKVGKERFKRIKTYCSMDFMPFEFYKIIKSNCKAHKFMSTDQVRSVLFQCFKGLEYIHSKRIMHRDIKSANILMNDEGIVKLADFGLAKYIPKYEFLRRTPIVVTLSYRAPEVLLTRGQYDYKIDVWSMGCFALELILNKPLFTARDEQEQIKQIMELCGSPTNSSWPQIFESELYNKFKPQKEFIRRFISYIRNQKMDFDDELLDLLDRIFILNPNTRLDVASILKHEFFTGHDLEQCKNSLGVFVTEFKSTGQVGQHQQQIKQSTKKTNESPQISFVL